MKAIVNSDSLSKELKKVSQVISPTTVIPILTSVKMVFEKGKLTLTATDLETTISTTFPCDCNKPFTVIVEHKDISDISDKLCEPITIEQKDKAVWIYADGYKSKIPISGNETEFPRVTEDEYLFTVDVDDQFFSTLYYADSFRFKDDIRVNMNTACIDFKKDGITIVGLDAFVMYKKDLKLKANVPTQALVRPRFVSAVKEMKNATMSVGYKFIKATHEGLSIVTRLQDNKYVDYTFILPKESVDYNFSADRVDFMAAIRKVAITSNKKSNMCVLNFMDGGIKITSQDIDYEKEGECEMRVSHKVEIDSIGFNSRQMLSALEVFDEDEVQMSFRSSTGSIYISQPSDRSIFCLVQPLMIN